MEDLSGIEVGQIIRQERRVQKLTLAQLAARADVSTSYVSQVERGVANPTLQSLKTLANALGFNIGSLLEGAVSGEALDTEDVTVMRAGARKRVILPGSNIANELLSPNLRKKMEVIWVEAPEGSGSGGHPHQHEGEECGVVISGAMRFWVGEREWLLMPGDAIYFSSRLPHRFVSAGPDPLVAIWIITPPTF